MRLTATFLYNATFSTNQTYLDGSNSTKLSNIKMELTTRTTVGNTTTSATATSFYNDLGNPMHAAKATSYQCIGTLAFTASSAAPPALATPTLTFKTVGVQSFLPLGTKRPSDADPDALCPGVIPTAASTPSTTAGPAASTTTAAAGPSTATTTAPTPAPAHGSTTTTTAAPTTTEEPADGSTGANGLLVGRGC